jgi:hypothetical protein
MPTPLQSFRCDRELWEHAERALDELKGARRITITVRPGMTRSAALVALLAELERTIELEEVGR